MDSTLASGNTDPLASERKPSLLKVWFVILPRPFAAPVIILAVVLGALLGGAPVLEAGVAVGAGLMLMASFHSLNTWTDFKTGVDKPGGSVEKSYTSGNQVIVQGWASSRFVLANTLFYFVLASLGVAGLVWLTESLAPLLGYALTIVFGAFYSPVWKYWGAPEATGLVAFGMGGVALGYSGGGSIDVIAVVLVGTTVSIPFAVSWSMDQLFDAPSDIQRGVRNIGGLLYQTGFPVWAYMLLGVAVTYVFQIFTISVGYLSPWTFLSVLTMPLWVLSMAWLYAGAQIGRQPHTEPEVKLKLRRVVGKHATAKGVRYGLAGIVAYELLLVSGEIIARLA